MPGDPRSELTRRRRWALACLVAGVLLVLAAFLAGPLLRAWHQGRQPLPAAEQVALADWVVRSGSPAVAAAWRQGARDGVVTNDERRRIEERAMYEPLPDGLGGAAP